MAKIEPDGDLIRRLAALLEETGLSEIEYESGGERIRVARHEAPQVTPARPVEAAVPAAAPAAAEAEDLARHPGAVLSPMVGTIYLQPEPGAPPFVRVGDRVEAGQTLLIVEAMKTMNPVPAPAAGTVARILVADTTPVEYGEVLMIIE